MFVDARDIDAVVVNEGLTTRGVSTCLAFVTTGSRLQVAFPHMLPRLELVQSAYRQLLKLLEPRRQARGCLAAD